ncbi:uncharacterized protein LOC110807417 [Carica papaya]|uniref:uncharacterized protein LOC110807417 n=1 Tax=Carica papaya TaxID=3649 RepID=UPI000B8C8CA1|nr:uncharacterized protein LOC110807417 [Carica papaya]
MHISAQKQYRLRPTLNNLEAEKRVTMRAAEDQQWGVFYELCYLIIQILKSPPRRTHLEFSPTYSFASSSSSSRHLQAHPGLPVSWPRVSLVDLALLLLGISVALMVFGSVAFAIGFVLLPWVLGLVIFFYFVGFMSSLSHLSRSIFSPADVPAWKF